MRSKLIPMVEDTEDDELLIRRALDRARIHNTVIVARDGREALDFFASEGALSGREPFIFPDLVLLDLKLPRVDGLAVLGSLRAGPVSRTIPVVVLSSSDEPRDIVESYRQGANSHVKKLLEYSLFAEAIERVCVYWLRLNVPSPGAE